MQLPSIPTWGLRGVANTYDAISSIHLPDGPLHKQSFTDPSVILFQLLCNKLTEALECCSGAAGALLQGSWRKLLRGFCNENLC